MIIKCKSLKKEIEIRKHKAIIWPLIQHNIPIASSCKGYGACKWCKITIISGNEYLSELTTHEKDAKLDEDQRLACQCRASGNIEIDASYW